MLAPLPNVKGSLALAPAILGSNPTCFWVTKTAFQVFPQTVPHCVARHQARPEEQPVSNVEVSPPMPPHQAQTARAPWAPGGAPTARAPGLGLLVGRHVYESVRKRDMVRHDLCLIVFYGPWLLEHGDVIHSASILCPCGS